MSQSEISPIDKYLENLPKLNLKKTLKIATLFSGIGAVEQAFNRLKIDTKIVNWKLHVK